MQTLRIAKTLIAMAAVVACMGAWADRRWTGGGLTADWNDSGNWDSGDGAHVFRHSKQEFTKKAVSFSSLVDFHSPCGCRTTRRCLATQTQTQLCFRQLLPKTD